jgi:hypothetical protein
MLGTGIAAKAAKVVVMTAMPKQMALLKKNIDGYLDKKFSE